MNSIKQNDRNFVAGGKDKVWPADASKSGSKPSKKMRDRMAKKRGLVVPSHGTKTEAKTKTKGRVKYQEAEKDGCYHSSVCFTPAIPLGTKTEEKTPLCYVNGLHLDCGYISDDESDDEVCDEAALDAKIEKLIAKIDKYYACADWV